MKQEIDPKETNRAYAFEMWMTAPMPMVTLVKTMNINRLVKFAKKSGMKLNMILCWCIGKTASQTKHLFLLLLKAVGCINYLDALMPEQPESPYLYKENNKKTQRVRHSKI